MLRLNVQLCMESFGGLFHVVAPRLLLASCLNLFSFEFGHIELTAHSARQLRAEFRTDRGSVAPLPETDCLVARIVRFDVHNGQTP